MSRDYLSVLDWNLVSFGKPRRFSNQRSARHSPSGRSTGPLVAQDRTRTCAIVVSSVTWQLHAFRLSIWLRFLEEFSGSPNLYTKYHKQSSSQFFREVRRQEAARLWTGDAVGLEPLRRWPLHSPGSDGILRRHTHSHTQLLLQASLQVSGSSAIGFTHIC